MADRHLHAALLIENGPPTRAPGEPLLFNGESDNPGFGRAPCRTTCQKKRFWNARNPNKISCLFPRVASDRTGPISGAMTRGG
jgi:hypothetical protein